MKRCKAEKVTLGNLGIAVAIATIAARYANTQQTNPDQFETLKQVKVIEI